MTTNAETSRAASRFRVRTRTKISTATVIAIVPILVITAIFQKQIVGGLTAGVGK